MAATSGITGLLTRITSISPLPAFCLSATVASIWVLAGFDVARFATLLHEDGTAIHTAWLASLGIWLVPKKAAQFAESKAEEARAQAVTAATAANRAGWEGSE